MGKMLKIVEKLQQSEEFVKRVFDTRIEAGCGFAVGLTGGVRFFSS
jgi:hypothetical protein